MFSASKSLQEQVDMGYHRFDRQAHIVWVSLVYHHTDGSIVIKNKYTVSLVS